MKAVARGSGPVLTAMLATLCLVWAAAYLVLRVTTPVTDVRLDHGAAAFDGRGVRLARDGSIAPASTGSTLVAIDGRLLDSIPWLSPGPRGSGVHSLEVAHGADVEQISVAERPFPLGPFVAMAAPVGAVLAVLLVTSGHVFHRRPRDTAANALLLFAATGTASAAAYLAGPGAIDLAGGPVVPMAALGAPVYGLTWVAGIAFALTFPRPWVSVMRHRRLLAAAGAAVVLAPVVVLIGRGASASVLDVQRIAATYSDGIEEPALVAILLLVAAGILKHRDGESRSAYAWVGLGFATTAALTLGLYAGESVAHKQLAPPWAEALVAIPMVAGLGYGVLHQRAFDLEVVVNRSLVYGGVMLAMLAVYTVSLAAIGLVAGQQAGMAAAFATTGIAAVLVQPFRVRLGRAVNRLMYGEADDPYASITRLGRRLEASLTPAEALRNLVESIARAFRLRWVAVTTERGGPIVAETGRPTPDVDAIDLAHGAEPVGTLYVARRPDPLLRREERLLADLVRQAGAIVHAVRLIDALQRDREALVVAREEQRRRVRNELHEGLGQSLAALSLELQALHPGTGPDISHFGRAIASARRSCDRVLAELHRITAELARGTTPVVPDQVERALSPSPDGMSDASAAPVGPGIAARRTPTTHGSAASRAALATGVVLVLIGLASALTRAAIPSDGWRLTAESTGWLGPWRFIVDQPLVADAPAGLRPGDVIVAVDGRPADRVAAYALSLRPVEWPPGPDARYTIERAGQRLDVAISQRAWTAFQTVGVIWRSVTANPSFIALLFLGAIVLARRPGSMAARLFFLASAAIFGSGLAESLGEPGLRVADFMDPGSFWLLQLFSSFGWALIITPLLVHLLLTFPVEAAWLRRHRRAVFAVLYLGLPCLGTVAWLLEPSATGRWSTIVTMSAVWQIGWVTLVVAHLVGALRSTREGPERAQLRWVAWGFLTVAAAAAASLGLMAAGLMNVQTSTDLGRLYLLVLPVALAVSIAKYRLFDIDVVLDRTLVYGLLSASLAGIYGVLVVGSAALASALDDRSAPPLVPASLIGAAAVALLAQPLRDRLQRAADRVVYGQRDEPYGVLSRLAMTVEAAVDPEDALRRALVEIAQALRLTMAAIELPDGDVPWSTGHIAHPGDAQRFPLLFQGQRVGTLVLAPRGRGDPLSSADRRLVTDLARQVAVGVHAARARRDLERSRARLARAADEERLRLRRDLHDGLGPTLAGIGLQIDAAERIAATDVPAAGRLLDAAAVATTDAIAEIRRLVHDLRPPALDELGLAAAIRRHAQTLDLTAAPEADVSTDPQLAHRRPAERSLPVVAIEAPTRLGDLPAAVEVAAFRIALEAITNVIRHAGARRCDVRLSVDDALLLEVVDDGRGLAADRTAGVGLDSMRERAAELGGWCRIEGVPGGGTRVHASLPLGLPSAPTAPAVASGA